MNRFFLNKIILSGRGHNDSVIEFMPGLNFILGPSNTGKSLVMDSIDYIFGYAPRKDRPSKIVDNSYGYEKIELHVVTDNGPVIFERKIGSTKITVSGSDPSIVHGTYNISPTAKKSINNVYLQLLGINEPHSVRAAEKGTKTNILTWRSMLHLFFVKQSDVARDSSSLLAPKFYGQTASASVLLFLLTGQDANDIQNKDDVKISEAKKAALIGYIRAKIEEITSRREELEGMLASYDTTDPRLSVEQIRKEIAELQSKLNAAIKESQSIISQIYEVNGKLSKSRTVEHNFAILRKQYQSDIRRIGFIVDETTGIVPLNKTVKCPFCGEETERVHDGVFIDASVAELQKIKRHLSELSAAQKSVAHQQETMIMQRCALEEKKNAINELINGTLQPQLSSFEEKLEEQLHIIRLSSELETVRQNEIEYRRDLHSKETEDASQPPKYNVFNTTTMISSKVLKKS